LRAVPEQFLRWLGWTACFALVDQLIFDGGATDAAGRTWHPIFDDEQPVRARAISLMSEKEPTIASQQFALHGLN
jgi:hypothetical protein